MLLPTSRRERLKFLFFLLLLVSNCYLLITMFIGANNNTEALKVKYSATKSNHLQSRHLMKTSKDKPTLKATRVKDKKSPFINPVSLRNVSTEDKKYIILQWNSPPWFTDWSLNVDLTSCYYKNCILMHYHAVLNESDLIVFNLPHSGLGNKPPTARDKRHPNQVWAFFTLEAPPHNNVLSSPDWQNVFNWSWTYKPSSDIFHPYGILETRQTIPTRNYSEIFHKKTNFAAWLVSNCRPPSKRVEYVEILQKYVKVDIYGRCGTQAPMDVDNFLSENYKFYLGFENTLCDDYMTEKFFHYYALDLITVVRGSTNYTQYLPDDSFINTSNFSSVTALAKFMLDIGNNEEKYVQYLKIKDQYTVKEREYLYGDALCEACAKLNNLKKYRNQYHDPIDWLGPCHEANDLKDEPSIWSNFNVSGVANNTQ